MSGVLDERQVTEETVRRLMLQETLTTAFASDDLFGSSPLSERPEYDRVFTAIARALHGAGRHALLVGERGVGQSTVQLEFARRVGAGKIASLRKRTVLRYDCRFVPAEESRFCLVELLSGLTRLGDVAAFIDGFASLLRTAHGTTNREALLSLACQCPCHLIGMMTPQEYDEIVADDPDWRALFTRIDLAEPSQETALRIVEYHVPTLVNRYEVTIDEGAVRDAVSLSASYILNRRLPSKALEILQHICDDIDFARASGQEVPATITSDDVIRIIAEQSGVPVETLRGIADRVDYHASIRQNILGQDHAVEEVATELGLIKAGMTDPGKPASVMLFVGQTGTGKTEMAKTLARFYSRSGRLRTFTLGNFVEPHSVSAIIGVPPGYVGHDKGGTLVNDLNSDPYGVFLLDEADKAHPDVLQPFLNLFDEGWIVDQRGMKAYADKSIFILTTNVGQRMIADLHKQGKSVEEITERMKEALSQIKHSKSNRPVFSPEFLARIRRVILFKPLDQEAMSGIARKLIREMREHWKKRRGKSLEIPNELTQFIATEGHRLNEKSQGKEGGRILHKLITRWIESPLQREISKHPEDYRACGIVAVECQFPVRTDSPATPTDDSKDIAPPAPEVTINFR